jgi:hypothetical protein
MSIPVNDVEYSRSNPLINFMQGGWIIAMTKKVSAMCWFPASMLVLYGEKCSLAMV